MLLEARTLLGVLLEPFEEPGLLEPPLLRLGRNGDLLDDPELARDLHDGIGRALDDRGLAALRLGELELPQLRGEGLAPLGDQRRTVGLDELGELLLDRTSCRLDPLQSRGVLVIDGLLAGFDVLDECLLLMFQQNDTITKLVDSFDNFRIGVSHARSPP